MKRESRSINIQNVTKRVESEKTLITNLPLLFANGKPVSLDKITLPELEEFVPFMVKCSLGLGVAGQRDLNKCPVPEWWPKEEFPFNFPLRGPSVRHQKLNSLRSLVCRCYTYYDCEFLLKFSAHLSLTPPSNLRYVRSEDNETTCIYDKSGLLLVKFRNENLMYDVGKHARKHLYPIIHTPSAGGESNKTICIDLTASLDDSSEDEKDVSSCGLKRPRDSRDFSGDEEIGYCLRTKKKKTLPRKLQKVQNSELIDQLPTPILDQCGFVNIFGLMKVGATIEKDKPLSKNEGGKKNLAKRFSTLPFSSERGRKILCNSRYTLNIQQHMDRIERHTTTDSSSQICTRTTGTSSFDDEGTGNFGIEDEENCTNEIWVHTYKWPNKCHNPKRMHRGPSLKACYVKLHTLSEDVIRRYSMEDRRTVATMTPTEWRDESVVCDCSLIPVISLIDDITSSKTSDKSCSTRCNCKTGKDIKSSQHNPHDLKNVASHIGNSNIPNNNNNSNRYRNNDNHTKKLYSSTNQKNSLGRTRSNGPPVLTEFPNFSYTSSATLNNQLSLSDKNKPYRPMPILTCELPEVKRVFRTRVSKPSFDSNCKTIISSKNPNVPENNDITMEIKGTGSNCVLFMKSRNSSFVLRKKNIAPVQWEMRNSRKPKSNSEASLHFPEPLQENLIPKKDLLVTKKRRNQRNKTMI